MSNNEIMINHLLHNKYHSMVYAEKLVKISLFIVTTLDIDILDRRD